MDFPFSAIASLGGAFLSSRSQSKANKQIAANNEANRAMAAQQFDTLQHSSVQNRVRDAKAAGIHPLAALGLSPTGTTASFVPESPYSGSAIGEGIARAGEALEGHFSRNSKAGRKISGAAARLSEAQIRAANASAARDEAEAVAIASEAKRAEQNALITGLDVPVLSEYYGAKTTPLDISSLSPGAPITTGKDGKVIPPMHWKDVVKQGRITAPGGAEWRTGNDSMVSRWEEDYGDVAGSIVGLLRLANDLRTNMNRWGDDLWKYVKRGSHTIRPVKR